MLDMASRVSFQNRSKGTRKTRSIASLLYYKRFSARFRRATCICYTTKPVQVLSTPCEQPMTTERLYFADPYLSHFSAHVVARAERGGQPAVALDQSAFYPEGGGQPPDSG